MCASIVEKRDVSFASSPGATCTSATCEKLPGKSLPREMSALVGAPPRLSNTSPEQTSTS